MFIFGDYFNVKLQLERQQEKIDFIELLGNEQILTILHELLPVIYTPMAQLFSRAHVGVHFQVLFKTLKRIIKATTDSSTGGPKRYVPILARFTNELYSFLHESAANDDHSIEDTLSWWVSLVTFAKEETIDLTSLLERLDSTTHELLLNELDQVAEFYDYRAELEELESEEENDENADAQTDQPNTETPPLTKTTLRQVPRPNLTYIPLLVDDFITMIKLQLSHQEPTPPNTTSETTKQSEQSQSQQPKHADPIPQNTNAPLATTPQS